MENEIKLKLTIEGKEAADDISAAVAALTGGIPCNTQENNQRAETDKYPDEEGGNP